MTNKINVGGQIFASNDVALPDDRIFRDAWEMDGPVIVENLTKSKKIAEQMVKETHAEFLALLTEGATTEERDTWHPKQLAATAHKDGSADADQTSMLQFEAGLTGETLDELSDNILTKAKRYRKLAGLASGHRRATMILINAATTAREVISIMEIAKTKAEALAASIG